MVGRKRSINFKLGSDCGGHAVQRIQNFGGPARNVVDFVHKIKEFFEPQDDFVPLILLNKDISLQLKQVKT